PRSRPSASCSPSGPADVDDPPARARTSGAGGSARRVAGVAPAAVARAGGLQLGPDGEPVDEVEDQREAAAQGQEPQTIQSVLFWPEAIHCASLNLRISMKM